MSHLPFSRNAGLLLVLGLAWGTGQALPAGTDKPSFWKAIEAKLPGKDSKPAAAAKPAAVPKEMIGTWVGQQDGMADTQFTLVLKKDNTFEFSSRLAGAALKQLPKGASAAMGMQKGTYRFDGDMLEMDDKGEAGMSKSWKLDGKVLVLDKVMRLKKTK